MIIALDCETQGLDATKFVMGDVVDEQMNHHVFNSKSSMWSYIKKLAEQQYRQGKVLNVYAHNHNFDFYAYSDLLDKDMKMYSEKPFIVTYGKNIEKDGKIIRKEYMKLLDTMAIYSRLSLEELGNLIGYKKLQTPDEFKTGQLELLDRSKAIEYMKRDAEIAILSIRYIKEKLKDEGINIKRLYTINQIAIQYVMNKLRKMKEAESLFYNQEKMQILRPKHSKKIHAAYRGPVVRCQRIGVIKDVTVIDVNSLYPMSVINMRFPDLRTEKLTYPSLDSFLRTYIYKIGLTRCLVYNTDDIFGLLPVRTNIGNYCPGVGKYMIGTWTNDELKLALDNNYKILGVEWTVTYEDGINPLKTIMEDLYKKRLVSGTEFDNYFYKQIMNSSIGKFAQTRVNQEFLIDSVNEARKYKARNYRIVRGLEYNYLYKKQDIKFKLKPYYCPTVPTLTNAYARIYMYKQITRLPYNDFLYSDTDSIAWKGNHLDKFRIGKDIGEFKILHQNEEMVSYGRKTYSIGTEVKMSGISKKFNTIDDFKRGEVISYRIITLKRAKTLGEAGSFTEEKRDLVEQMENFEKMSKVMDEQKIYIDKDIEDIKYLLPRVKEIAEMDERLQE